MIINLTKIVFVISMFAVKNNVNIFKKYTILNTMSIQVKNLTKSIKNTTKIFFIR